MPNAVLIIEDNDIERQGMGFVLREAGFTVSMAPNTSIALAYPASVARPDLILLDMMMPEKDGWYFLDTRKLNPQLADVPVLIVTGMGVASQEWAASLGAAGLVRKPFDAGELCREIERCVASA
jgi:CheY-like chemotaxis protein